VSGGLKKKKVAPPTKGTIPQSRAESNSKRYSAEGLGKRFCQEKVLEVYGATWSHDRTTEYGEEVEKGGKLDSQEGWWN